MIASVADLPFNKLVGLEPGGDAVMLRLPAGGQYLNHVGTVHAGALLTLAEAASGEFLLRGLGAIPGVVPVVRRMEAKFRKPAQDSVTAAVPVAPELLSPVVQDLRAKRRALVSIPVELHDQSGTHVLSATVEWFIAIQE